MNPGFVAFDNTYHLGESATHPLARLAARLPLSLVVAGPGLPASLLRGSHTPRRTIGCVQLRFLG